MKFWLNGQLGEDTKAVAINDRGFLLGDGIFETFYVHDGKLCERDAHLARLEKAADQFAIHLPYSLDELINAMQAVLSANEIETGSLRLTVSRGTGPRGLLPPADCKPTVLITAVAGTMARNHFSPLRLMVSSIRRNDTSPASRHKTIGGYLDNILALKEAQDHGVDDALLLNTQGNPVCTTSANLIVKTADGYISPPETDGALPGIFLEKALKELSEKGHTIIRRSLEISDFENATEIFVSNSLIGLRPVQEIQMSGNIIFQDNTL